MRRLGETLMISGWEPFLEAGNPFFRQESRKAPSWQEGGPAPDYEGVAAAATRLGPRPRGRGVGRRRRPTAATDGGGDGGDGHRCDPVSSPNVKGRGASPATPWYVPTIVAFG